MSLFLDLRDAIVAALTAATPVAGGRVVTGRKGPMPAEWQSMVCVRTERHACEPSGVGQGPNDWTTEMAVEIQARGSSALDAEAAIDPVLLAVYARLRAIAPATLAALCVESIAIDPVIERELFEGDTELASATVTLRVVQRAQAASLTAWS